MDPDGRGAHPRRSKSIECSVFLGLGRALAKSAVVAIGVYPGSDPGLQVRTRRSSSLACFPLPSLTRLSITFVHEPFRTMAEFLDTQGVSYYLKKLVNNATDKLYLISPYLQLNNQLKLSLKDRHKFSIDIIVISGKVSDIDPDDSGWLRSIPGIKLLFHKDLHAKCYFNEKEAILTSINLYMFSQQNNVEMGIYISKEKDEELYKQIAAEIDRIKRGSEHRTISVQKVEAKKPEAPVKPVAVPAGTSGSGKYHSVTAMSKEMGISSKDLFARSESCRWIVRSNDTSELTSAGKDKGGQMRKGQYGDFIAWPDPLIKEIA